MIVDDFKYKLYVAESQLDGRGLYTNNYIKSKSILAIPEKCLYTNNYNSILLKQTSARCCLDYFIYGNNISNEDFLNHSDDPNCIYHCGILFAIKDINPNEELTINYNLIIPKSEVNEYTTPLSAEESFKQSLKIMCKLFNRE